MLEAQLYTAIHRGVPGDVDRYRAACRGTRRVLELGCGDGRILGALAPALDTSRGLPRLMGIDCHAGMLKLAAERHPMAVWVQGDMTDLELGERFERVLIPFSGFWCLPDAGKLECLRRIASHLEPGGLLCFDVYGAEDLEAERFERAGLGEDRGDTEVDEDGETFEEDADELEDLSNDANDATNELEEPADDTVDSETNDDEVVDGCGFLVRIELEGKSYAVFEQNRYRFAERRVHARFDYRVLGGDGASQLVSRQIIEHHYLPDAELTSLLDAAGLQRLPHDRCAFSGFDSAHGQIYIGASVTGQSPDGGR